MSKRLKKDSQGEGLKRFNRPKLQCLALEANFRVFEIPGIYSIISWGA